MARAGRMVAHTHAAAQHNTMALIVGTGMPAYPIPAKIEAHAIVLVTHLVVPAQCRIMDLPVSTGMPAHPIPA